MEVTARAAVEADLTALAALVREALAAAEGQKGAELWRLERAPQPPIEASLERLMGSEDASVIAGCVDDVPVGVLLVDRRALVDGRRMAGITLVFVHPEARQVGVGEALVDGAVRSARRWGCIGLDGLALPGDRHTKNLYERAGLSAREIVVYRDLAPDGDG